MSLARKRSAARDADEAKASTQVGLDARVAFPLLDLRLSLVTLLLPIVAEELLHELAVNDAERVPTVFAALRAIVGRLQGAADMRRRATFQTSPRRAFHITMQSS